MRNYGVDHLPRRVGPDDGAERNRTSDESEGPGSAGADDEERSEMSEATSEGTTRRTGD